MDKYEGLAPEFRPGGTKDPKWMEGVRSLLAQGVSSVEPEIVIDLFEYYDALKERVEMIDQMDEDFAAEELRDPTPEEERFASMTARYLCAIRKDKASEAEAEEAIKRLKLAIHAAENSNQAGENAVVRAAAVL